MKTKTWLFFALTTTVFWGIWGAFIEIPEKAGFPATLGYSIWAWLVDRKGTLEQAIKNAGTRTEVPHEELVKIVRTRLQEKGIQL